MITITDQSGDLCVELEDVGEALVWTQNKVMKLINSGEKNFSFEARDEKGKLQLSVVGYPTLGDDDKDENTLMFPSVRWDFHWLEDAQSNFENGSEL